VDDSQFGVLEIHLKSIADSYNRQSHSIGRIFDELGVQGKELAEVKIKLDALNGLKEDVKCNTMRLHIARGVGLTIAAVFGSLLGWLRWTR